MTEWNQCVPVSQSIENAIKLHASNHYFYRMFFEWSDLFMAAILNLRKQKNSDFICLLNGSKFIRSKFFYSPVAWIIWMLFQPWFDFFWSFCWTVPFIWFDLVVDENDVDDDDDIIVRSIFGHKNRSHCFAQSEGYNALNPNYASCVQNTLHVCVWEVK